MGKVKCKTKGIKTMLATVEQENKFDGAFFEDFIKDVTDVSFAMARESDTYESFNFILGKDMYERESMDKFLRKFVEVFCSAECRVKVHNAVFTGNSGIGKTAFFNALKNDYDSLK
jgi:DNA replication protein DnaC